MRQGDGSDLLGPDDPRNSDIGILYVTPMDSRQEILTAINTQDLQGRKHIAIVLPDQGKAFRQPLDFDGLKNVRRALRAQLVFIAPSGSSPAEFARQRRFPVYSSLDTFKTALLNEDIPEGNARVKSNPGTGKKPGLLAFGSRKSRSGEGPAQNPPPSSPASQGMPPLSPTPRVQSQPMPALDPAAFGPQDMPPTPRVQSQPMSAFDPAAFGPQDMSPTPRMQNQARPQVMPPTPPTPRIDQMDTVDVDQGNIAHDQEDENDMLYAPPTPMSFQGGPVVQGSVTPIGPAVGPTRGDSPSKPPNIIAFPSSSTTSGSGNLTPAQSPTPRGSGKLTPAQSPTPRGSGKLTPAQSPTPRGSGKLAAQGSQGMPGPQNVPADKSGGSGKTVAVAASGTSRAAPVAGGTGPLGTTQAATAAGGVGGPGVGQRSSSLVPQPPPRSRHGRRGTRWGLLLVLLFLLTLALIGGFYVEARGGISSVFGITANVTITPATRLEQDNYVLQALPTTTTANPTQRQIPARALSVTSATQPATINATGTIPATKATGTLTFINTNNIPITLAPTPIPGSDGVEVSIYQNVVVPAAPSFTATVPAYAVNPGTAGNIKAFDVSRSCCTGGITVKNTEPFTGGQDEQLNSVIQQSDIDKVEQPLVSSLTKSTQSALQAKIKSTERVADGTSACPVTITGDPKANEVAKSVPIQVSVTCKEEVYDYTGAQQMGVGLLQAKAQGDLPAGSPYALDGQIVSSVVSATLVSVSSNQVVVEVQAQGLWVYHFTDRAQQSIKQSLVKLQKSAALNVLQKNVGVAAAKITLSSGSIMPTDPNAITLTIVTLPGVQSTPGGTQSSPGVPTGSPTGPSSEITPEITPTATLVKGS